MNRIEAAISRTEFFSRMADHSMDEKFSALAASPQFDAAMREALAKKSGIYAPGLPERVAPSK
ncbi:hypothetical protein [Desulfocurvus sp. DL9XJH121]